MEEYHLYYGAVIFYLSSFAFFALFSKRNQVKQIARWVVVFGGVIGILIGWFNYDCGRMDILVGSFGGCNLTPLYLSKVVGQAWLIANIFGMFLIPLLVLLLTIAEISSRRS